VTSFRPGETITLQWNILIEHGGHKLWRVAIDDSGQDFPDPVTANDTSTLPFFMDKIEVDGKGMHTLDITLPMITCDNCTLQMVQYTYDTPPYPGFYHQCADIVIAGDPSGGTATTTTNGGTTTTTATTSGGGMGGSGSTTGGAGAGGTGSSGTGSSGTGSSVASSTGTGVPPSGGGGCSVAAGARGEGASYGLMVVALAGGIARRRRHVRGARTRFRRARCSG
jgi:MYXO-CTERM domain-containing protein